MDVLGTHGEKYVVAANSEKRSEYACAGASGAAAAHAFFSELRYDDEADLVDYTVGLGERCEVAQRKSGKQAWSTRLQHKVREVSFAAFATEVDSAISFQRVCYFKRAGNVVWPAPDGSRSMLVADDHALVNCHRLAVLPDEAWVRLSSLLRTRDLSKMATTHSYLRDVIAVPLVWKTAYSHLFGLLPGDDMGLAGVRDSCRSSEMQAAPWIEEQYVVIDAGARDTLCLALDADKIVGNERDALRMWSYDGRRLGTLQGHTDTIACLAVNQSCVLSADISHVTLKLWDIDSMFWTQLWRVNAVPTACVFIPQSSTAVVADIGGGLSMFSVTQNGGLPSMTLQAAGSAVALNCAPDGAYFCAGGYALELFDTVTGVRRALLDSCGESSAPGMRQVQALHVAPTLLAAGSSSEVSLWDLRVNCLVGRVPLGDMVLHCAGVHLDSWKLTCAVHQESSRVQIFDLRALDAMRRAPIQPIVELDVGGRAQCLAATADAIVVGRKDLSCRMWTPLQASSVSRSEVSCVVTQPPRDKDRRVKKGKIPVNSQNRFPKRR
eukprot:TRINITY_DN29994_c0_g1_i1.p1 TRINITY_DN29994_c0_g1~~TRINITY_DN29994_c0_g1_i1.p1  ORF type:complete len:551 (-),score=65.60 TRINITY_DN29994_c0_g1_i1:92-1744(-)